MRNSRLDELQAGIKTGGRNINNLRYADDNLQNARLDELQARVKNARRNFSNLRYVDDTTLTAESKEELKSLLMRVKEEGEKASLKLNIKNKTKIMASSPFIHGKQKGKRWK